MFRNETRATEKRAQRASKKLSSAAAARKQGAAEAESSTSARLPPPPTTTNTNTTRSPFELAVIPAIQINTETQASCHFVSNFVLLPRHGRYYPPPFCLLRPPSSPSVSSTRGFMDYLIPVMKNDPRASHLQFAFNACALASLGNRVNSIGIDFHERSFAEYVKALQATNAAIRDPKKSTSDSLLAAVLLLSMFEVGHPPFPPLTEQELSLTPPPEHHRHQKRRICLGLAHRRRHPTRPRPRPQPTAIQSRPPTLHRRAHPTRNHPPSAPFPHTPNPHPR